MTEPTPLEWAADFILDNERTPSLNDATDAGFDRTDPIVRKACGLPVRDIGGMSFPFDISDLVTSY